MSYDLILKRLRVFRTAVGNKCLNDTIKVVRDIKLQNTGDSLSPSKQANFNYTLF